MTYIRRRLALWICPEIANELRVCTVKYPVAKSKRMKCNAAYVRELDRAFTRHFGKEISFANAPAYGGPMYKWPDHREAVRLRAVSSAVRLRRNPFCGASNVTSFRAINYFASVLPKSAWPADVPRPQLKEEAA